MKANDDEVHVPVSDNFELTLTENGQVVSALLHKMVFDIF
jgi:hypothetical protein